MAHLMQEYGIELLYFFVVLVHNFSHVSYTLLANLLLPGIYLGLSSLRRSCDRESSFEHKGWVQIVGCALTARKSYMGLTTIL